MTAVKPPKQVEIGPFTYSISYDLEALQEKSLDMRDSLFGYTITPKQEILISPGLAPDMEADTVLHEVLHAVFESVGIQIADKEGKPDEEDMCKRLAPAILALLRDNPKLVNYLITKQ